MERQIKITFMILVLGLIIGNLSSIRTEAKQVEVKKQTNQKVKVAFLNDEIDENVKELVIEIKNRTDDSIKIKEIVFQRKAGDGWIPVEKKQDTKTGCNIKIGTKESAYSSILLTKKYKIPKSGLESGKYSVCAKYKYKGNYYDIRKTFKIVRQKDSGENSSTTTVNKAQSTVEVSESVTTTIDGAGITGNVNAVSLLNYDFFINKKGNGRAMIFSEAYYAKTDKVKITLKVQKKFGKKWKKVKKYIITKRTNLAFANKNFKFKSKGIYRMNAKITFYKKGRKQGSYTVKTKPQKF